MGDSRTSSGVTILPVTDAADIPTLAEVCGLALEQDKFSEFLAKYSGQTFEEESFEKLTKSLDHPEHDFIFKAVVQEESADTGEMEDKIVGVSHWYVGYLNIPKMDPFAVKEKVVGEEPPPNPGVVAFKDMIRRYGNARIISIRGKRYVYLRRLFVHPGYQRRGIGHSLLQWGLDVADSQSLVCWLGARESTYKLYLDAGYKTDVVIDINAPDMAVPPIYCMTRPRRE